ncbi:hypothetical protein HUG10_19150 (plasmid) [Halorarum halophilum]|uniref:DUF7344 domain-containing protein n=1 Tax=Halorarum halophilum TaxID=2743090 RepID=A0A7D5GP46_9EURY|nr:hypothetical protein [Halobaculum halophilum]QLG29724.1 hypothetical protein HUG10_19150 [Halobaculum halophilum]
MSELASAEGEIADRRTRVVRLLETMETPVTVDRIVDELEADRRAGPGTPAYPRSWEDLHEALHDEDLPVLDSAGLLVFDAERGLVTRRGEGGARQFARRDPAPPRTTGDGGPPSVGADQNQWAAYYFGVAVLSMLLLGAEVAALGPFAGLPATVVSGAVVCLFALLASLDVAWN